MQCFLLETFSFLNHELVFKLYEGPEFMKAAYEELEEKMQNSYVGANPKTKKQSSKTTQSSILEEMM